MKWIIIASWWAQEILDRPRRNHLTTDPACERHRAPRPGSWLDRASRGLECEPCMVRRAFGGDECGLIGMLGDHEIGSLSND